MQTAFTPMLFAICCLSAPALAEMTAADLQACNQAAATGQLSDDCNALLATYYDRVTACLVEDVAADQASGSTQSTGPQTNRMRWLQCSAKVREGLVGAAK